MEPLGDAAARLLRRLERGRGRPAEANSAEIGRGEVSVSIDSRDGEASSHEANPISRASECRIYCFGEFQSAGQERTLTIRRSRTDDEFRARHFR